MQALVEFLNEQLTSTELYTLGVLQFSDGNDRVLVPRLAGATSDRRKTKGPETPPGYRVLLEQADETTKAAASKLEEWAESQLLAGTDFPAACQWRVVGWPNCLRLYPAGIGKAGSPFLEVDLAVRIRNHLEREAGDLLERLQGAVGHALSSKLPALKCPEVVSNWASVRPVLDELAAVQRQRAAKDQTE